MNSVKVAVRVRPISRSEDEQGAGQSVHVEENTLTMKQVNDQFSTPTKMRTPTQGKSSANTTRQFNFDYLYDDKSKQEDVYRDIGETVLENAFSGYNASVFAYGQTGSGKTHTMVGSSEERGLIPRITCSLVQRVEEINCSELGHLDITELEELSEMKASATVVKLEASYLEIYNETCSDLLEPSAPKLKVREHPEKGAFVEGLSTWKVRSFSDVEEILRLGAKYRTVATTKMNARSSRSHAIFTLVFTQTKITDGYSIDTVSKINLVDLAGSERVSASGVEGTRLKETANINKSLHMLGRVINALSELNSKAQQGSAQKENIHTTPNNGTSASKSGKRRKQPQLIVPYRDSLLTWLLKPSLGGNSKTTMLVTVSPASYNYEETLSSLRYAKACSRIINNAVVNRNSNSEIVAQLRSEIDLLRDRLECTQKSSVTEDGRTVVDLMSELQKRHDEEVKFRQEALAKYEQNKHELSRMIESLEQKTKTQKDELLQMKSVHTLVETDRNAAKRKNEVFELRISRLQEEVSMAHEEAACLARAKRESDLKFSEQLNQKTSEIAELRHLNDSKALTCSTLETDLDSTRKDLEQKTSHIAHLGGELDSLKGELVGSSSQRVSLQGEVKELKTGKRISGRFMQFIGCSGMASLSEQMATLKEQLSEKDTAVFELEHLHASSKKTFTRRVTELEEMVEAEKEANLQAAKEVQTLTAELQRVRSELSKTQKDADSTAVAHEQKLADLKKAHEEVSSEREELDVKLKAADERKVKLAFHLETEREKTIKLEEEGKRMEKDLNLIAEDLEARSHAHKVLEEELDNERKERLRKVEVMSVEIADLKEQLSSLESEHNTVLSSLAEEKGRVEDKSTENERLCARVKELSELLANETFSKDQSRQQVNELNAELGNLRDQVGKLQVEHGNVLQALASERTALEEKTEQNKNLCSKVEELSGSLEMETRAKDNSLEHADEMTSELVEVKHNLDELQVKHDELVKSLEAEVAVVKQKSEENQQLVSQLEELSSALANEKSEKDQSLQQAATLSEEVEELKSKVASGENEIKSLQATVEEKTTANRDLSDRLEQTSSWNAEQSQQIVKLEETVQSLEKSLSDTEATNEEIRHQLEAETMNNEKLTQRLEEGQQKMEELKEQEEESKRENEGLDAELCERRRQITEHGRTIEELQQSVAQVSGQLKESQQRTEELEKQLSQEQTTNVSHCSTIEALKQEAKNLEESITQQKEEISQLVAAHERAAGEYSDEIRTLSSRVQSLEETLSSTESAKESLASALQDEESENKARRERIEALEGDKAAMKQEIGEANATIAALKDEAASQLNVLTNTKEELESVKSESAAQKEELVARTKEITSFIAAVEEYKEKVGKQAEVIASLEEVMKQLQKELGQRKETNVKMNEEISAHLEALQSKKENLQALEHSLAETNSSNTLLNQQLEAAKVNTLAHESHIENIEKEMKGLEENLETLRSEQCNLSEKYEDLCCKRDELISDLGSKSSQIEDMEGQISTLHSTSKKLEGQIAELKDNKEELEGEVQQLSETKDTLLTDKVELAQSLSQMSKQKADLEELIELFKSKIREKEEEINVRTAQTLENENQIASLETELARVNESLDSKSAKLVQTESSLKEVSAKLAEATNTIGDLDKELSSAKSELFSNQNHVASLEEVIASLESNITSTESILAIKKTEIEELSEDISEAHAMHQELQSQLHVLQQDKASLEDRNKDLASKNAGLDQALQEKSTRVDNLGEDLSAERAKNSKAEAEAVSLNETIQALESKLSTKQEELLNTKTELSSRIAALEGELSSLNSERKEVGEQKAMLESRMELLRSQTDDIQRRLKGEIDDLFGAIES